MAAGGSELEAASRALAELGYRYNESLQLRSIEGDGEFKFEGQARASACLAQAGRGTEKMSAHNPRTLLKRRHIMRSSLLQSTSTSRRTLWRSVDSSVFV